MGVRKFLCWFLAAVLVMEFVLHYLICFWSHVEKVGMAIFGRSRVFVALWRVGMIVVEWAFEEAPPQPEPEPETLMSKAMDFGNEVVDWCYSLAVTKFMMVAYGCVGLLIAVVVWVTLRWFWRMMRVTSLKIRGVKGVTYSFEALRQGSTFGIGTIPSCQVAIQQPGTWSNKHVGYGIRVGDVLVTPTHVVRGWDTVVLANYNNGVEVQHLVNVGSPIESRMIADLSYIPIPERVWTTLAVKKAKIPKGTPGGVGVTVTGKPGSSFGSLRKTGIMGQVVYSGSTLPGMSGAAYTISDQVYGIHSGVSGNNNVGIGIRLVQEEMATMQFLKGESDLYTDEEVFLQDVPKKTGAAWTDSDLKKEAKRLRDLENEDWIQEHRAKGTLWSEMVEEKADDSDKIREARKNLAVAMNVLSNGSQIKLKTQGVDEETNVYRVVGRCDVNCAKQFDVMKTMINGLLDRVQALEIQSKKELQGEALTWSGVVKKTIKPTIDDEVKENEAEKPKKERTAPPKAVAFPCQCGVVCRSDSKLANHKVTCKFVGEAALGSNHNDSRKYVKQNRFLDPRTRSQSPKLKQSKKTSNSWERGSQSRLQEEFQSQMLAFQQETASTLKNLLKVMTGQNSVVTPN